MLLIHNVWWASVFRVEIKSVRGSYGKIVFYLCVDEKTKKMPIPNAMKHVFKHLKTLFKSVLVGQECVTLKTSPTLQDTARRNETRSFESKRTVLTFTDAYLLRRTWHRLGTRLFVAKPSSSTSRKRSPIYPLCIQLAVSYDIIIFI